MIQEIIEQEIAKWQISLYAKIVERNTIPERRQANIVRENVDALTRM